MFNTLELSGWKTFAEPSHFSDPSQNFVYCSILLKTFSKEKSSQILLKEVSQIYSMWNSFSKASQRLLREVIFPFTKSFYGIPSQSHLKCILKRCPSQILSKAPSQISFSK